MSSIPSSPLNSGVEGEWTVRGWLLSLRLDDAVISKFESNGFDDREDIRSLTDEDLEKIGVSLLGTRRKLLRFAQQL